MVGEGFFCNSASLEGGWYVSVEKVYFSAEGAVKLLLKPLSKTLFMIQMAE